MVNSDIGNLATNFTHFKSYYTVTGSEVANILPGLQEIYAGIPDNCVFELLASFKGTMVRLTGLKATNSYGLIKSESYAEAANKRYDILNGVWTPK